MSYKLLCGVLLTTELNEFSTEYTEGLLCFSGVMRCFGADCFASLAMAFGGVVCDLLFGLL